MVISNLLLQSIIKNDHLADINIFLYDSNGFLWVGTNNNGLYRLDYENLSIIDHYTLIRITNIVFRLVLY